MHVLLLAQVNDMAKEFTAAADRWGLGQTVLLALVIVMFGCVLLVVRWLKPKLDQAFNSHMNLIATLNIVVPAQKDELQKQTASLRNLESLIADSNRTNREMAMMTKEAAIALKEQNKILNEHNGKTDA